MQKLPELDDAWLAASDDAELRARGNWQTPSHQSTLRLLEHEGKQYIVKAPRGRGVMRWLTRHLLRKEYRLYQQLTNMPGVPQCLGLVRNEYLILEYIGGQSLRHAQITDHETYFAELLNILKRLHARGVAHGDLKNKDNLLVVAGSQPVIIDFGIAVRFRPGFHPFNHFWFRLAQRIDYNAWIKHKYGRRPENLDPADLPYWNRGPAEHFWRGVRNLIQRVRGRSTSNTRRPDQD